MTDSSVACEVCAAEALFWADIKGFAHYRCRACKHLFVYPRPSGELLTQFYQSGDYYRKAESERSRLRKEARDRALLLGRLAARYCLRQRLLDVGCASGIFLREAASGGWSVTGVERSEATAAKARRDVGCNVLSGVFEVMEIPGAPFEVVTAWEVVEHVPDVRSFIAALANVVQPGGMLAVSTPQSNGLVAKLMGRRFPMLTPPEHLSIFSKRSLKALAAEVGLYPVDVRSFSNLGFPSLVSGFSQILFGKRPVSASGFQWIASTACASVVAWAPWLVDQLGGGSEIQVIFRKRT